MWSLFDKGNVHIHGIQTYLLLQTTDDTDANGSIIYGTVIVIELFFLCIIRNLFLKIILSECT